MRYQNESCLNCGDSQEVKGNNIYQDNLGKFIVCSKCESSFDVESKNKK